MNNKIELKAVRDLMGMNFFIPAYQRGYRWIRPQVEDLLEDIYNFAIKKNKGEKEFYCLQPIVVKGFSIDKIRKENRSSLIDGAAVYEVIDGQQRLTTLKILVKYLEDKLLKGETYEDEYGFSVYQIVYETRPELALIFNDLSLRNEQNIDYDHITSAYKYIEDWFAAQNSPREAREAILRTLVNDFSNKKSEGIVQVIWYEIGDDSINPVDTFLRINMGKIPLTNGELVKAIFLQENNFGKSQLAELQQMEIAQEWDIIERTFHDVNFWGFISNKQYGNSTRIEFVLNLYYQLALLENPSLSSIIGSDDDQIFRYFHHIINDTKSFEEVENIWSGVKDVYNQIQEWFTSVEWYHYIGFLIEKDVDVLQIFIWIESLKKQKGDSITKEDVTMLLIEKIRSLLKKVKVVQSLQNRDETIVVENPAKNGFLDVSYKDSVFVRDLLLLYNLQYVINQNNNNNVIYRFSFKSYKNVKDKDGKETSWDIEHIDSSTDKILHKLDDQNLWLRYAYSDLSDLPEELNHQIEKYLSLEKADQAEFDELYKKIKDHANEDVKDDSIKNNIGNLTLLDAKTNRGYGNALFISKRRIIIENDKKGLFIPPLTKNIFLKYHNVHTVKSDWTIQDMEFYNLDIKKTLLPFLTLN